MYHKRKQCGVCGNTDLKPILEYGEVPLAGSFPNAGEIDNEKLYNLDILFCEKCSLVQTDSIIDPETLFRDYRYMSSIGLSKHFEGVAEYLKRTFDLDDSKRVVEIGCIPGGHLVTTSDGFIPIESVTKNTRVLTHKNRFKKVVKTFSKFYKDNIYTIKCRGLNSDLKLTKTHPVLTRFGWKRARDLKIGDEVNVAFNYKFHDKDKLDILSIFNSEQKINLKFDNDNVWYKTNGIGKTIPRHINLEDDFFIVLGYFIGEGSTHKNTFDFSFSSKELDKVKFIEKYLYTKFNLKSEIQYRHDESTIQIRCNSRILTQLFQTLCGKGAHNKQIPEILSLRILNAFIYSLWFTDGHKTDRKYGPVYVYSTVSHKLGIQLLNLLRSIGIMARLQKVKNNRGFSKNNGSDLYRISVEEKQSVILLESYFNGRDVIIHSNNFYYFPVRDISTEKFNNKVYNFEVEDDNSYVCDSVVSHNSNDGVLLVPLKKLGVVAEGFEPATNIAEIAEDRGVDVINTFFNEDTAKEYLYESSIDLVVSNNCFAHIEDLHSVVKGLKYILKPGGHFVFEVSYVKDLIEQMQYDNIYHEHIYYYTFTAICNLFKQFNMTPVDYDFIPIHNGSIRVCIKNSEEPWPGKVESLLSREASIGMTSLAWYSQ